MILLLKEFLQRNAAKLSIPKKPSEKNLSSLHHRGILLVGHSSTEHNRGDQSDPKKHLLKQATMVGKYENEHKMSAPCFRTMCQVELTRPRGPFQGFGRRRTKQTEGANDGVHDTGVEPEVT